MATLPFAPCGSLNADRDVDGSGGQVQHELTPAAGERLTETRGCAVRPHEAEYAVPPQRALRRPKHCPVQSETRDGRRSCANPHRLRSKPRADPGLRGVRIPGENGRTTPVSLDDAKKTLPWPFAASASSPAAASRRRGCALGQGHARLMKPVEFPSAGPDGREAASVASLTGSRRYAPGPQEAGSAIRGLGLSVGIRRRLSRCEESSWPPCHSRRAAP